MPLDNALWKAVLSGLASNMNTEIMVLQIEAWFIWKDNLVPISLPGAVFVNPLQTHPLMVCREGLSITSFSSCSMLVSPLLPNSHHFGTVPLQTSCYCVIRISSFSKTDNFSHFKIRELLEFLLLCSRILCSHIAFASNKYSLPVFTVLLQLFIHFRNQFRGRCARHAYTVSLKLYYFAQHLIIDICWKFH